MNKRTRLLVLLAVIALCFVFLWPSISWYARTPKELQQLALGSNENIKSYAELKAAEDVRAIKKQDLSAPLADEYAWLKKDVTKRFKALDKKVPAELTLKDVLSVYDSELDFMTVLQTRYRDEIVKAKKYYENSVKLGLDLSGGMNIIVKADLDAALESMSESSEKENDAEFKKEAMANVIENLASRIDKFGLTSPVIRQQGEDRIYIEIPGAAQADAINTLIMGKKKLLN